MEIEYRFGLPIVDRQNFWQIFDGMGLRPWPLVEEVGILEYLKRDLTEEQRKEFRFLPPLKAGLYVAPDGKPLTFFHCRGGRRYAMVFSLLPGDFVPVIMTFRPSQGEAGELKLQLPSGGIKRGESAAEAAKREFEEETSIELAGVTQLTDFIPVHVGGHDDVIAQFLGIPRLPVTRIRRENTEDEVEHLKSVLFPLAEWDAVMDTGATDLTSIVATHRGLRKLGVPVVAG